MAIIQDLEIWYPRLVPSNPNDKFDKKNPSWDIQVRTKDPNKRAELASLGINMKAEIPADGGEPYFRYTFKKKTKKSDLVTPNAPVEVIDGAGNAIDPMTIGNGSVANVRVYLYEYTAADNTTKIGATLMGVQLIKHIMYIPKPKESFKSNIQTEVVPAAEAPAPAQQQPAQQPAAPAQQQPAQQQPVAPAQQQPVAPAQQQPADIPFEPDTVGGVSVAGANTAPTPVQETTTQAPAPAAPAPAPTPQSNPEDAADTSQEKFDTTSIGA